MLDNGADVKKASKNGQTAIMFACLESHVEIVNSLLKAGANPNTAMSDGRTPLILASIRGHSRVLRYLVLHKNIDLHATDNMGKTALMYAEENNHDYAITILQDAMK